MIEENEYLLTTIDNPYDPFTHFDEWYAYDNSHGYHTNEWVARIAPVSSELTDKENDRIILEAYDDIVRLSPIHKLVKRST